MKTHSPKLSSLLSIHKEMYHKLDSHCGIHTRLNMNSMLGCGLSDFKGIFQKNNLSIEEYFIALSCPWCVRRTYQLSVWLCFKCEGILRCNWWKKNVFLIFYNPKKWIKSNQPKSNHFYIRCVRYACLYPNLTRGPVPILFFFFFEKVVQCPS